MRVYQKVTMPKLHGTGPKNLASAIRLPTAPNRTFSNFKEAMDYLKKKNEQKDVKEDER